MSKRNRRRNRHKEVQTNAPVVPQVQTLKIGIDPPPDHIYKFRRNRRAPAQEVWGTTAKGSISYAPCKAEYIDGEGCFVYYYGIEFPSKCVALVQEIHAINPPKRLTINALQFLAKIHKKGRLTRFFQAFNDFADMTLLPYYLHDGYYCKFVKEVRKFVEILLTSLSVEKDTASKTGEIVGMFFEKDNAYRWRVQDIAGETTKEALLNNFPKEANRLIEILASRETVVGGGQQVVYRFKSGAKVMKYLWWFPWTKKAIKNAISAIDLENCKMDEADLYHAALYGDYNTKGRSLEERMKIFEGYHGTDMSKWPPRIEIRQTG